MRELNPERDLRFSPGRTLYEWYSKRPSQGDQEAAALYQWGVLSGPAHRRVTAVPRVVLLQREYEEAQRKRQAEREREADKQWRAEEERRAETKRLLEIYTPPDVSLEAFMNTLSEAQKALPGDLILSLFWNWQHREA